MSAGFTPGPWRIRENARHDLECCDLTICGDIFQLADINGPQYAHQIANANLIAAAPDLYAALEALDEHWAEDFRRPGEIEEPRLLSPSTLSIWRTAIAALAKARGEAA